MNPAEDLRRRFRERFGGDARVFRAPGRVNLIGEHTDYNDGFVMPTAIDLWCWVAASARTDNRLILHSENLNKTCEVNFSAGPPPRARNWSDYPVGVAAIMARAGFATTGANLLFHSDLPLGGGLSSSAAIEVATFSALAALGGHAIEPAQAARLCQQAEHEYAGVRCGIMDQFIALHGAEGCALLLDCRSLAATRLPIPPAVRLVICNTMVRHELAAGEYNKRRADCEEAVRLLTAVLANVSALRDVAEAQLNTHRDLLPERVFRRARHVVTENARTQEAAAALRDGDLARFGRLMAESHASLRDDYEVSCTELDQMVAIALRQPGVHGARMTGGGFGGCTINLVESQHTAAFRERVAAEFAAATRKSPEIYVCAPAGRAGEVV